MAIQIVELALPFTPIYSAYHFLSFSPLFDVHALAFIPVSDTYTSPPPLRFKVGLLLPEGQGTMIQRIVYFPSLRKLLLRAGSNSASSKVINVLLFYAFSFIHIYHLRLKIEIRYILISVFRCSLSVAWARLFFNDDKLTCNNNQYYYSS